MRTVVFSDTLELPEQAEISVLRSPTPEAILSLARNASGPVYLCGGGDFAGWMLDHGLIDRLILKRTPCVLGSGTPLFG
ncbi:dihydrofolate reductase family protein, partial [Planococcus sp. SIMBA_160]